MRRFWSLALLVGYVAAVSVLGLLLRRANVPSGYRLLAVVPIVIIAVELLMRAWGPRRDPMTVSLYDMNALKAMQYDELGTEAKRWGIEVRTDYYPTRDSLRLAIIDAMVEQSIREGQKEPGESLAERAERQAELDTDAARRFMGIPSGKD